MIGFLLAGCAVSAPPPEPEPELSAIEVTGVAMPEAPLTPEGSALALGDAAWLPAATLGGDAREVGFAVLDVVGGEASFWERFDNAAEFGDDTPYFVFVQVHDPSPVGSGAFSPADMLWPVHADGSAALRIQNQAVGIAAIECPEFTIAEEPGAKGRIDCFVAVGDAGQPVAGASYQGRFANGRTAPGAEGYLDAPVLWLGGGASTS